MTAFETYRVCRNCFINTITKNPPILEKYHYCDKKSKTCSLEWAGINVGYYPPKNRWFDIRPNTFISEHVLYHHKISG